MKKFKDLLNANEWNEYDKTINKFLIVGFIFAAISSLAVYFMLWNAVIGKSLAILFFAGSWLFFSIIGVVVTRQSIMFEAIKKIEKVK